jgi:hypothetical protein
MPEVLSAAGGCSLIEAAMRVALGEAPSDEGLFPCDRVGYRINLQPPMSAHRVGTIEGLEVVGDLPGVLSVKLRRRPGDAVDWRLGTDEQVLNVVGAADSLDEVHAMRRQVAATVSISYD